MDTTCKRRNRVRTKISLQDFNQHAGKNESESIFLLQKGFLFCQKLFRAFYGGVISETRGTVPHDFFSGGELCFKTFLCISEPRHTCLLSISCTSGREPTHSRRARPTAQHDAPSNTGHLPIVMYPVVVTSQDQSHAVQHILGTQANKSFKCLSLHRW